MGLHCNFNDFYASNETNGLALTSGAQLQLNEITQGGSMLKLVFPILFFISFIPGAHARRYFVGQTKVSKSAESELELQIRLSHRLNDKDEWESEGVFSICYSATPKEACYQSVGNVLTEIGLPKDKNDPVTYTRYAYEINFGPPNEKEILSVKSEQVIEWQPDGAEYWKPVTPSLLATSTQVVLGQWVSVEFREARERFTKLEVRMQRSE